MQPPVDNFIVTLLFTFISQGSECLRGPKVRFLQHVLRSCDGLFMVGDAERAGNLSSDFFILSLSARLMIFVWKKQMFYSRDLDVDGKFILNFTNPMQARKKLSL